ncbi:MAG: peptidylprolyl isomerase [Bacteroidales bacterium]|nr:peptidylprolyl isomerase [Bacteroidales bacterium]
MKKTTTILLLAVALIATSCSSQKKIEKDSKKNAAEVETKTTSMTQILIKTSMGDITIALYNETPQHRDNFIKLVKENYYDGVLFHRIIKGFMIQTGDPDSKTAKPGQRLGMGGPSYRIPAEFVPTIFHKRGAVAAARDNNPAKASSGSQFYIVDGTVYDDNYLNMIAQRTGKTFSDEQKQIYTTTGGAPFLDGDYTVFGEVTSGMDVVDKIAAQQKDGNDRPLEDIKILSAKVIE